MSACDWSDGVAWPAHLHRRDCRAPCEHRGAAQWRAGSRVPLSAPPHLAVTEALMSSPSLCWSSSPVPPAAVPSRTQASLPRPGATRTRAQEPWGYLSQDSCHALHLSEHPSGQQPRGRQAGSSSPPLARDGPHPLDHPAGQAWSSEARRPLSGLQLGRCGSGHGQGGRAGASASQGPGLGPTHVPEKDGHGGRAPAHTFAEPCTVSWDRPGPPECSRLQAGAWRTCACTRWPASAFWEARGDGFCGQEGPLLEQKASGCGP